MQSEKIQTEILIIGAGPSGATASLFLSKYGIEHLILDAATFPRDKICGDGLDLKVFRVLNDLDPEISPRDVFQNEEFVESWGIRLIAPNGRRAELCYEPRKNEINQPPLRVAKRLHFDDFLVKKIDPRFADFRQNTKVLNVSRFENGWKVLAKNENSELEISTKIILAADGDHSVMLHELGERKIDRRNYAGTIRQYHAGVTDIHPKKLIELYFPEKYPMSYFYIFPLPGGEANVGYGMVSEITSQKKYNLREIFTDLIQNDPFISPRFSAATALEKPIGWGLPLASRRRKNFGDGYLLLGDAASLVCPTSGEGIGTGMMSGLIAAKFVQKALAAGRFDADFFKNYDREVYRRLKDEIRSYNILMTLRPWTMYNWGINRVISSNILPNAFQKVVGGWLRTAFEKEIDVKF